MTTGKARDEMAGLTSKDYKAAIDVQDACNLSGVVNSFSGIIRRVREEAQKEGKGTDWVNHHPICVLFTDKMADLAGRDANDNFHKAYVACTTKE